jgi:hypothetical protein
MPQMKRETVLRSDVGQSQRTMTPQRPPRSKTRGLVSLELVNHERFHDFVAVGNNQYALT